MADREDLLQNLSENMAPSARSFILWRDSRSTTAITPSKASRHTLDFKGKNFRTSLSKRNIYITNGDPPSKLMERAGEIFSRPHLASEMDDTIAGELRLKAQRVATEGENIIVRE